MKRMPHLERFPNSLINILHHKVKSIPGHGFNYVFTKQRSFSYVSLFAGDPALAVVFQKTLDGERLLKTLGPEHGTRFIDLEIKNGNCARLFYIGCNIMNISCLNMCRLKLV